METIAELTHRLKLTPSQAAEIEKFCSDLIVDLLESLKQENDNNFDETISAIKSTLSG